MGNCGGCNRTNAPERGAAIMSKQDRVKIFEESLPFKSLYIDEYESLVLAVVKARKVNEEYVPPLNHSASSLSRIVRYFKGIEEFSTIQNPQSRMLTLFKSAFLAAKTYSLND